MLLPPETKQAIVALYNDGLTYSAISRQVSTREVPVTLGQVAHTLRAAGATNRGGPAAGGGWGRGVDPARKAEVLAYAYKHGPVAAHRKFGVSRRSIWLWRNA